VIVKVNNREVTPDETLSYIVGGLPIGQKVPIELIRGGQRTTVTAVVGQRPPEEQLANFGGSGDSDDDFSDKSPQESAAAAQQALGIAVQPLTPAIARQIGAAADTRGLVVSSVDASTDAGAKGLQRGDVILSANNRPVTTEAEFNAAIAQVKASGRNAVLLQVQRRGGQAGFIAVRLRDK